MNNETDELETSTEAANPLEPIVRQLPDSFLEDNLELFMEENAGPAEDFKPGAQVVTWILFDQIWKYAQAMKAERDEADRRAGAAERSNAWLTEGEQKRKDWLRNAKREAGYKDSVSFDVVWKELLDKAGVMSA